MREIKDMTGAEVLEELSKKNKILRDMFMMGHSRQSNFEQYYEEYDTIAPELMCREWFMAGSTHHWTFESFCQYTHDKFLETYKRLIKKHCG